MAARPATQQDDLVLVVIEAIQTERNSIASNQQLAKARRWLSDIVRTIRSRSTKAPPFVLKRGGAGIRMSPSDWFRFRDSVQMQEEVSRIVGTDKYSVSVVGPRRREFPRFFGNSAAMSSRGVFWTGACCTRRVSEVQEEIRAAIAGCLASYDRARPSDMELIVHQRDGYPTGTGRAVFRDDVSASSLISLGSLQVPSDHEDEAQRSELRFLRSRAKRVHLDAAPQQPAAAPNRPPPAPQQAAQPAAHLSQGVAGQQAPRTGDPLLDQTAHLLVIMSQAIQQFTTTMSQAIQEFATVVKGLQHRQCPPPPPSYAEAAAPRPSPVPAASVRRSSTQAHSQSAPPPPPPSQVAYSTGAILPSRDPNGRDNATQPSSVSAQCQPANPAPPSAQPAPTFSPNCEDGVDSPRDRLKYKRPNGTTPPSAAPPVPLVPPAPPTRFTIRADDAARLARGEPLDLSEAACQARGLALWDFNQLSQPLGPRESSKVPQRHRARAWSGASLVSEDYDDEPSPVEGEEVY
jgi:hypothetical protein